MALKELDAINDMKYLKAYLIFLIIISTTITSAAQDNEIYNSLFKLIKLDNELFYSDKYFEKGFVFSVHMAVNRKGVIDSVTFSHFRNDDLSKLVDFDKIKTGLMQNKKDFRKYKKEVLILIVVIIRGDYGMTILNNGNQIKENWMNIISSTRSFPNRKQIFLGPMLISSEGKTIHF